MIHTSFTTFKTRLCYTERATEARQRPRIPSNDNTMHVPTARLGCGMCIGELYVCVCFQPKPSQSAMQQQQYTTIWVYRGGVWVGIVMSALLFAVVFCWVDHCVGSWVLLGLFCLLRVSQLSVSCLLHTSAPVAAMRIPSYPEG